MGSAVSPEFVATVASSIAVGVHPEACQALAHDVEYRLREVIQDALKFASRSRRSYLTTEDVNSALRLRNVQVRAYVRQARPLDAQIALEGSQWV